MIRYILIYLKPVALFLSIVVLFQCCMVYDKKPVMVEQAINKNHKKQKRIKIELLNGEIIVLDSIYYKDNELYGLQIRPKKKEKVLMTITKYNVNDRPYTYTDSVTVKTKVEIKIDEDKIAKIWLYNTTKSRTRTAFLSIFGIVTIAIILIEIFNEDDPNQFTFSII